MRKLIYFGLISILFSSCFWGEREVYLIPQGYEGPVVIMFDEVDGQQVNYEEKKRVYEIPTNGILYTQFKDQDKYVHMEFYYLTKKGDRTKVEDVEIQLLSDDEKETLDAKVYRYLVYGSGNISFIVGKLRDIEKHWSTLEELKKEVFKDGTVIMHAKEKE